ncbi:MAG TPA: PqqD family peptide modification chaperone [bacterium]|nr:PqqD family peptide modification chaperone [bacterium]HOL46825.1 PqqD family peptide modification chaperone [bacterium]HPQ18649.1 PqqD family peptide modification chaperone [bacterium]
MKNQYKLNKDLVIRKIDGEIVLLNMKTGSFYSTSDSGQIIFEGLANNLSIEKIKEKIKEEYEIKNEKKFEDDFNEFLEDLLKEKIIKKI